MDGNFGYAGQTPQLARRSLEHHVNIQSTREESGDLADLPFAGYTLPSLFEKPRNIQRLGNVLSSPFDEMDVLDAPGGSHVTAQA